MAVGPVWDQETVGSSPATRTKIIPQSFGLWYYLSGLYKREPTRFDTCPQAGVSERNRRLRRLLARRRPATRTKVL